MQRQGGTEQKGGEGIKTNRRRWGWRKGPGPDAYWSRRVTPYQTSLREGGQMGMFLLEKNGINDAIHGFYGLVR